jgi:hypothetical protein
MPQDLIEPPSGEYAFVHQGGERDSSRGGLEVGYTDPFGSPHEGYFHRHSDLYIPGIAFNDVAEHLDPLLQFHQGQDIGDILGEPRSSVLVSNGERPYSAFATGFDPLDVIGPAVGADASGVELVLVAAITSLNNQVTPATRLPEGPGLANDSR